MREWIVTNGLGSYSSLTYQNTNSRKYHGLLIASLKPPTERWVFLSNIFDQVQIGNNKYDLRNIKADFNFDFFPSFIYEIDNILIKKTIFMEYKKNTTIIRYKIDTNKPIVISHNPIINSRHIYDVNGSRYLSFKHEILKNEVNIKPSNIDKTIKIILKDFEFKPLHYWEESYYNIDHERNESWIDNNVHIGRFQKNIDKSIEYYIITTVEDDKNIDPIDVYENQIKRKKRLLLKADLPVKLNKLVNSTDNFIVKRGEDKTIIAGYHWFGEWGRDSIISVPGLTLVTKRFNDAKKILINFSKYCKNGLIPNLFSERDSKASYNTVDASLWFIDRVYQYMKYTNDITFLEEIWNTLESIINGYQNGTDFGISMDSDYLISHEPGLTWMDIKIDNNYITPRSKKAVEIQALWYNSLMIMSSFSDLLRKKNKFFDLSEKVKNNFISQYDQLYDVIDTKDKTLRPNIIFLVSLDFNMIDKNLQKKIVSQIQEKLLTIFGLRSISPDDSRYKGRYIGAYNKDISYHNGTVWPWLIGPFIKSFVKINKFSQKSREDSYKYFLKPMIDIFGNIWDGSIYEIFDGDSIYYPRGCISQAWSVAEVLRTWVEDIENIRPSYDNIFESLKISV